MLCICNHNIILPKYLEMVKKIVKLQKKWKIAVDPGCGATYSVGPKLLQNCGCNLTVLNSQPDGTFPARKSEPTKESLQDLSQIVKIHNLINYPQLSLDKLFPNKS